MMCPFATVYTACDPHRDSQGLRPLQSCDSLLSRLSLHNMFSLLNNLSIVFFGSVIASMYVQAIHVPKTSLFIYSLSDSMVSLPSRHSFITERKTILPLENAW